MYLGAFDPPFHILPSTVYFPVLAHFLPTRLVAKISEYERFKEEIGDIPIDLFNNNYSGNLSRNGSPSVNLTTPFSEELKATLDQIAQEIHLSISPTINTTFTLSRWLDELKQTMDAAHIEQLTQKFTDAITNHHGHQPETFGQRLLLGTIDYREELLIRAIESITRFFTSNIRYLGPLRTDPGTTLLQFSSSGELDDVGFKGEYAAFVYHTNQHTQIDFYHPETFQVEKNSLHEALDIWSRYLGIAHAVQTDFTGTIGMIWKVVIDPNQAPHLLPQVGVGVSQILPILVMGLLASTKTLLIIEQPELHLHPRVQARLGDFFLGLARCGKCCLIETHSASLTSFATILYNRTAKIPRRSLSISSNQTSKELLTLLLFRFQLKEIFSTGLMASSMRVIFNKTESTKKFCGERQEKLMHNVLFDPILLIVPEETASAAEVEVWFETLDAWARAIDTNHNWYHLRDQIVEHLGYERFPNFRSLRTVQQRYHLDITLQGIALLINKIFFQDTQSFRPALEAHLLNYGLIVEPLPFTIALQPSYLAERWPEELGPTTINTIAEAGIAKSKGEPFCTNLVIATTSHPAIKNELRITGKSTILSEGEEPEHTSFSDTFMLVSKPEELVTTDILMLWNQGAQGVTTAFEQQFKQNWATTVMSPLPFILGPQFLLSVCEHGTNTNAAVLSKIIYTAAAVIANQAKNIDCELHPLRETKAANSTQRTRIRDGAKAWRLMLTNKGIGWRMHYWHIPGPSGGRIEFSNILRKHDPELIF